MPEKLAVLPQIKQRIEHLNTDLRDKMSEKIGDLEKYLLQMEENKEKMNKEIEEVNERSKKLIQGSQEEVSALKKELERARVQIREGIVRYRQEMSKMENEATTRFKALNSQLQLKTKNQEKRFEQLMTSMKDGYSHASRDFYNEVMKKVSEEEDVRTERCRELVR